MPDLCGEHRGHCSPESLHALQNNSPKIRGITKARTSQESIHFYQTGYLLRHEPACHLTVASLTLNHVSAFQDVQLPIVGPCYVEIKDPITVPRCRPVRSNIQRRSGCQHLKNPNPRSPFLAPVDPIDGISITINLPLFLCFELSRDGG